MARIAYLTGRAWKHYRFGPGELPFIEAPDHKLIVEAGKERGLDFEIRYWDDPTLPEQGFNLALIKSCWDYTIQPRRFAETLEAHEQAGLRVLNPSSVVRWNAQKTYLKELGPSTIDTIWADKVTPHAVASAFDAFDCVELVVKPQVGAGAANTIRLKRNAWSEHDLIEAPPGAAMLQPFLKSIETEGERSLFWFGDAFSHSLRKAPKEGTWLANQPGSTQFINEPAPREAMEAAEAARARAPKELFYVRVDLVRADAGDWRVIEIEAIEPYLFLDFAPEGADVLAGALTRVLSL